ncbi:MAG: hypothetical protein GEV08_08985, partial [Acidimicrobiia bacterium]|nr:hypothetical protein [Acidimicrobiia bacterium]
MAHGLVVAGAGAMALGIGQGVAAGQTGSSQISGTVFNDLSRDGVRQSSEPGIGAVGIQLRDSAGDFLASTSTSQNGSYSFGDLEPGTYRVVEVANAPGYSEDTTTNMIVVNLSSGASGVDFGDARAEGEGDSTVSVNGLVWVDNDRDGAFDSGEPGATEVRVLIADSNYDPIIWLNPAPDGSVTWEGDAGGSVVIRALPPDGWVGTTELVAYADPGGSGEFAFGVASPEPPTTTTTTPTTTVPPDPGSPPTTASPGDGAPPPPGQSPDLTAPPPTTTTPRAPNVPINADLAPIPSDPSPRSSTTDGSIEVAGVQASRLAATGRDSSDKASSAAAMIVAGVVAVVAGSVL